MMKAKLGMSESRIQYLESKQNDYESKIERLEGNHNEAQSTIKELRSHLEACEKKFIECQVDLGLLRKIIRA